MKEGPVLWLIRYLVLVWICPSSVYTWLFEDGPIWRAADIQQSLTGEVGFSRAWHYIESSLICRGDRPNWLPEPFRDYRSLLAVCATQEFGGDVHKNMGGYHPVREKINIVFREVGWLVELDYLRLRLYCRAKCMRPDLHWRNLPSGFLNRDPPFESHWRELLPVLYEGSGYGIINFDTGDETVIKGTRPWERKSAHLFFGHFNPDNALLVADDRDLHAEYAVLGESDKIIRCYDGSPPSWPIEPEYYNAVYPYGPDWTFNGLCRAAINGGMEEGIGNAGGVCRTAPDGQRHVYFEDEFASPYLSWKWEPAALPIALLCFRSCWCGNKADGRPEEKVPWLNNAVVVGGSNSVAVTTTVKGVAETSTFFENGRFLGSKTTEPPRRYVDDKGCIFMDNGQPYCLPAPAQGELTAYKSKTKYISEPSRQCSGKKSCRGVSDCAGSLCHCVADFGKSIARGLAQNTVFPAAACLGLSQLASSRRNRHGRRTPDEVVACVCNATYVSASCCGSQTGIIWEAPEGKIGILSN